MPKKFFNVNKMKKFHRVTSFTKYDIYSIIPELGRVDFTCILHLTAFICQPMVFIAHGLQYEGRAYQKTFVDVDLQIYF